MGVVSIVLVQSDKSKRRQITGELVEHVENVMNRKNNGDTELSNKDVNKFIGLAIFHERRKKIKKFFENKELGGETT